MLTKKEKLEIIQEQAKKHEITAYEFGNNTNVSTLGAQNVLSGESKNPRNTTLNIMLEYLEQRISGEIKTPLSIVVEDPTTSYKNDTELEKLFIELSKKLKTKFDNIEKRLHFLENKNKL